MTYAFDVFGGERRTVEGLQARALAQNFRLEASYLALTSSVAATAIQLASVRGQMAATQEIIAVEETSSTRPVRNVSSPCCRLF